MAQQMTKRVLSTVGAAVSLVGVCAMAAPQATAAGSSGGVGPNSPMVAGLPLTQVLEHATLSGNGSNNH